MGLSEGEFERVAMPHARSLLRFALRLTRDAAAAEDLVQETLLLAWRGFGQFESGTNARAWLFRILINAFHAQNRKARSAQAAVDVTSEIRVASDSAAGHRCVVSSVEYLEVMQALDRLGADQKAVLLLAVVEGFTCREIADILTVPIGTVMSRLGRAREAMRELLGSDRHGKKVAR